MQYCTICFLNGKDLIGGVPVDSRRRRRCSWCRCKIRNDLNLKATFNMFFIHPDAEMDIEFDSKLGPICNSCNRIQSSRPGYSTWEHYSNIGVNRKITCRLCATILSYIPNESFRIDDTDLTYNSSSDIVINNWFMRKLLSCWTCQRI